MSIVEKKLVDKFIEHTSLRVRYEKQVIGGTADEMSLIR
jgi:hypothetical protein